MFIQYWSMRVMAYLASLVLLLALWGGWLLHRRKLRSSRLFLWMSVWAVITPFLMNTAGWLLTESGRQPWIVQGLQKTVQRQLAVGERDRDLDQPECVRAGLHRARRRRPGADAALLAPRSGAGRRGGGRADRAPGAVPALTY